MKVIVVGGGGLGTVFAGYLGRAGVDVSLLVKPAQAAQIPANVVQIEGAETFSAPVQAISSVPPGAAFDYLILCVKGRDTDAALQSLRGLTVGAALSLQNGAGKDEALARVFGHEHVLGALTYVAATAIAPGRARITNPAGTYLGELDGRAPGRAQPLAAALQRAGLPAVCTTAIVTLEWYKLAVFLRTALVSAITRLDVGRLAAEAPLRRICATVALEVVRVAEAEGYCVPRHASDDFSLAGPAPEGASQAAVDAPEEDYAAVLAAVGAALLRSGRSFYPSLAQDVIAGRPSELEATAGDVLVRAVRHSMPAPVLRTCTDLVRGIEAAAGREPGTAQVP
jgi:2-dehydropantoate 2-reductase